MILLLIIFLAIVTLLDLMMLLQTYNTWKSFSKLEYSLFFKLLDAISMIATTLLFSAFQGSMISFTGFTGLGIAVTGIVITFVIAKFVSRKVNRNKNS